MKKKDCLNKIIHGDCLDVMKGIPDGKIDLIITDPPYGIEYSSQGGPRVSKQRRKKISEETKIKNDKEINLLWFKVMYRTLKDNSALYCFCSFDSYSEMKLAIKSSGFKLKTPLIWDKGNCGMGDLKGDYGNQTELIIYAVKERHILNLGRDRNILSYQRPADAHRFHPTQKPVELLEYLIIKSSKATDLIVDPFIGSGSTAVACINTNRNFIGIELDEKYVKIARDRISGA